MPSSLKFYAFQHKHNLAVVVGPASNRKMQEVALFQNCSHFETALVFSSLDEPWHIDDVNYVYADLVRIVPDFLASFVVRKPYSPVSFVKLKGLENCLEDADIINCIELYSFISCQCAGYARKHGKKLAVSIFETIPSPPLHKFPPFSRNVKKVLRQADIFLAYTNRSAEYLRKLSVPDEKIKVIYPGIDLQKFRPARERNHESIRVLFVGGFAGEKGLGILLEAFSKLCLDECDVELWVCAKPRSKVERTLIEEHSQKRPVKAFGYVDYDRMPEIYRQCDVLCLPSFDKRKWCMKVWEEEFGFALVEAMASGLPIIASDCGAVREVTGNDNLIVPQKSVEALYIALCKAVDDESWRSHTARVNRKRAEKLFDIEKQRVKIDKVLSELL